MALQIKVSNLELHNRRTIWLKCPICDSECSPNEGMLLNEDKVLYCNHCFYVFPAVYGFLYTLPPDELISSGEEKLTAEAILKINFLKQARKDSQTALMSYYYDFMGEYDA